MSLHIALVRGINVGGNNRVAMADLRALCASLGLAGAATLLQSGNLVFQSERLQGAALEQTLEAETVKRLKVQVDYVVRTAPEWEKIVAQNPFPAKAKNDPAHLLVMFLKTAVSAKQIAALQAAITGREIVQGSGKQLYIVYPDGVGRSKLTGALIERTLASRGTARNWNTAGGPRFFAVC